MRTIQVFALFGSAMVMLKIGRTQAAISLLVRADRIAAKSLGIKVSAGLRRDIHFRLGMIRADAGEDGLEHMRLATSFAERVVGEPESNARVFSGYGFLLTEHGLDLRAMEQLSRAADVIQAVDDPFDRSLVWGPVAQGFLKLGLDQKASDVLELAATDARRFEGPEDVRCNLLWNVASMLGDVRHFEVGLELSSMAIEIAPRIRDRWNQANAWLTHGFLLTRQRERYAEAITVLNHARLASSTCNDPLTSAKILSALVRTLSLADRPDEAARIASEAASIARSLPDPVTRSHVLLELGADLVRLNRESLAISVLQAAEADAEVHGDRMVCSRIVGHLGGLAFQQERWNECVHHISACQKYFLEALGGNRWPHGVARLQERFGNFSALGIQACELRWKATGDNMDLFRALQFADGTKCVSIREGLRRHSRRESGPSNTTWKPAPLDWQQHLFPPVGSTRSADSVQDANRGPEAVRGLPQLASVGHRAEVLELPGAANDGRNEYTRPITIEELKPLLPDQNTVLVVFSFIGEDLIVFPVRRVDDQVTLCTSSVFFRVNACRSSIGDLVARQDKAIRRVLVAGTANDELMQIYADLYEIIQISRLIRIIEPDPELRRMLHLILVPDGPLFRLPLHAAVSRASMTRLYEIVASVRFAVSLRTLELQHRVQARRAPDEQNDQDLRGVAFANPDWRVQIRPADRPRLDLNVDARHATIDGRTELALTDTAARLLSHLIQNPDGKWLSRHELPDDFLKTSLGQLVESFPAVLRDMIDSEPHLPGVIEEVKALVDATGCDKWMLHGEQAGSEGATRDSFQSSHNSGNVVWAMGHGGPMHDRLTRSDGTLASIRDEPSFLLCDGPVGMSRLISQNYDFSSVRLLNFSCCLLGRLDDAGAVGQSNEVLGYIPVLTMLGCRRVAGAIWELSDVAAVEFSRQWIGALYESHFQSRGRSAHEFATAFRIAIDNFRRIEQGRYDHEFYWAPYMLYGLG